MATAIEELMAKKGMNQSQLESASGIHGRRIGDYVRGQHTPSTGNMRKLCKALDTTVDKLMDRAEDLVSQT